MTLPLKGQISAADILSVTTQTNNFAVDQNIFRQIAFTNRAAAGTSKAQISWSDFYGKIYNEVVTAPASVSVNQLYNMTVTGGPPNSVVTYTQNGLYPLNITLDSSGNYTFLNTSLNAAGSFTYSFTFTDGNVRSATTVAVATAAIVLTISVNSFTAGDAGTVTLFASVTPFSPKMPTGTVTITGSPDGTKTLPLNNITNNVSTGISYSVFAAGTYTFKATYGGDTYHTTATSGTVQLVVAAKVVAKNVYMTYTGPTTFTVVPYTNGPTCTFSVYSDGQVTYSGSTSEGPFDTGQRNSQTLVTNGMALTTSKTSWLFQPGTITSTVQTFTTVPYCETPGTYTVDLGFVAKNSTNAYNWATAPKVTFTIICKQPRAFFNADFESSTLTPTSYGYDIPGWYIITERIYLNGGSTIAGWPTPSDNYSDNYPMDYYQTENYDAYYSSDVASGQAGKQSLVLFNDGWLANGYGYGIVHGPVAYNKLAAELLAGDVVAFWWKAVYYNDAYDVYAYLVNNNTGATINLLNATGKSSTAQTAWTKQSVTITAAQAGFYTFVFISGSYDFSGGCQTGAKLLIDNLTVNGVSGYY